SNPTRSEENDSCPCDHHAAERVVPQGHPGGFRNWRTARVSTLDGGFHLILARFDTAAPRGYASLIRLHGRREAVVADVAAQQPAGGKLFVRQSSGLVREVSVMNALFFNTAAFIGGGVGCYPAFYAPPFRPLGLPGGVPTL